MMKIWETSGVLECFDGIDGREHMEVSGHDCMYVYDTHGAMLIFCRMSALHSYKKRVC